MPYSCLSLDCRALVLEWTLRGEHARRWIRVLLANNGGSSCSDTNNNNDNNTLAACVRGVMRVLQLLPPPTPSNTTITSEQQKLLRRLQRVMACETVMLEIERFSCEMLDVVHLYRQHVTVGFPEFDCVPTLLLEHSPTLRQAPGGVSGMLTGHGAPPLFLRCANMQRRWAGKGGAVHWQSVQPEYEHDDDDDEGEEGEESGQLRFENIYEQGPQLTGEDLRTNVRRLFGSGNTGDNEEEDSVESAILALIDAEDDAGESPAVIFSGYLDQLSMGLLFLGDKVLPRVASWGGGGEGGRRGGAPRQSAATTVQARMRTVANRFEQIYQMLMARQSAQGGHHHQHAGHAGSEWEGAYVVLLQEVFL